MLNQSGKNSFNISTEFHQYLIEVERIDIATAPSTKHEYSVVCRDPKFVSLVGDSVIILKLDDGVKVYPIIRTGGPHGEEYDELVQTVAAAIKEYYGLSAFL